jgi:hypothetical protein
MENVEEKKVELYIFSAFNSSIERGRGVLHNISENTRKKGGETQLPVADGRTEWNPLGGHVTDEIFKYNTVISILM